MNMDINDFLTATRKAMTRILDDLKEEAETDGRPDIAEWLEQKKAAYAPPKD
jgi:hypothetical protein